MGRFRNAHPILIALLPALLVYAHNASQLHPAQLLRPLALAVAFSLLSYAAFLLVMRSWGLAALLTSVWVLCIFSFGHGVNLLLSNTGWPLGVARWVVLTVSGALLLAVGGLARRAKRRGSSWRSANLSLLTVTLLLVLVQLGRVGWTELQPGTRTTLAHDESAAPVAPADPTLPDIYFILLDGYGRSDVLREMYAFDNGDFVRQLRDWGFHVTERSYANYVGTLWSLASTFNMDYVQKLAQLNPASDNVKPLIRLILSNRVVDTMRRRGYRIVALASGYASAEFSLIDDYLDVPQARNDFEQLLIDTTPLPWIWDDELDAHDMHRRRLQWILREFPRLPDTPQPRFVFVHIIAPHPPFVFDRNGDAVPTPAVFGLNDGSHYYWLGGSEADYQRLYADQARWVTEKIQVGLQELLHNSATPPVVVLMSDHGPGSQLNCDELGNTNLRERFGILNALLLPGVTDVPIGDRLAPVNTFRVLFDLYFDMELGTLPERSYFSTAPAPFEFLDITKHLP